MRIVHFIFIFLYLICVGAAAQVAIYTWRGHGLFIVLCQIILQILGFWATTSAGSALNRNGR